MSNDLYCLLNPDYEINSRDCIPTNLMHVITYGRKGPNCSAHTVLHKMYTGTIEQYYHMTGNVTFTAAASQYMRYDRVLQTEPVTITRYFAVMRDDVLAKYPSLANCSVLIFHFVEI